MQKKTPHRSDKQTSDNDRLDKAKRPVPGADVEDDDERRYQWPPPRDPNLNYANKTRNPVQSVITALPLLMLVAGLYFYFHKESQQAHGLPVMGEAVEITGLFAGLSATSGRHYLWVRQDEHSRSVRVSSEQVNALEELERGVAIAMRIAPRVSGSKTFWALNVEQSGKTYLDSEQGTQPVPEAQ